VYHLDGFSLQQYRELLHSLYSRKVTQEGVQGEGRLFGGILCGNFQMKSLKRNSPLRILSRLLAGVLSIHGHSGHSHMGRVLLQRASCAEI
jgi:hypothetical protein